MIPDPLGFRECSSIRSFVEPTEIGIWLRVSKKLWRSWNQRFYKFSCSAQNWVMARSFLEFSTISVLPYEGSVKPQVTNGLTELYFFPSTMIIWYPNFVFTGGSVYTGLLQVEFGNWNAASWNCPTIDPLVIQPRSPPCRAWKVRGLESIFIILPHMFRKYKGDWRVFPSFPGRSSGTPCPLTLSSEKAAATLSNDSPALSFSIASKHFDCFSHKMWRTCNSRISGVHCSARRPTNISIMCLFW